MTERHETIAGRSVKVNGVMTGLSRVSSRTGTPQLDARMRDLYRSMNTYDIAQVLHVSEAQVHRVVFGRRAQTLGRTS